jgi:hypothetical protein
MKRGVSPSQYLIERFEKFLSNDWVHLERRVATLDGKMHILLAMVGILVALMVYSVTK